MTDELSSVPPGETPSNGEELEGEGYEEITSDEVDRIVGALEDLVTGVDSENIKSHLEDAIDSIYYLVYDEEDDADTGEPDPLSDAA